MTPSLYKRNPCCLLSTLFTQGYQLYKAEKIIIFRGFTRFWVNASVKILLKHKRCVNACHEGVHLHVTSELKIWINSIFNGKSSLTYLVLILFTRFLHNLKNKKTFRKKRIGRIMHGNHQLVIVLERTKRLFPLQSKYFSFLHLNESYTLITLFWRNDIFYQV